MQPIQVVPAKKRHATALGAIMRPACIAEAWAAMRATPAKAVRYSLNNSAKAWAVYVAAHLIAVGGLVLRPDGWAVPWVMTSVHVDKHRREFWYVVKDAIAGFRGAHPALAQMIHHRQEATLRMAERLGFVIGPGLRWGKGQELFYPITLIDAARAPQARMVLTPGEAANAR